MAWMEVPSGALTAIWNSPESSGGMKSLPTQRIKTPVDKTVTAAAAATHQRHRRDHPTRRP